MTIGKAIAVFEQIDSPNYTEEEKALAIHEVLNMPTHNSITKDSFKKVARYLHGLLYEVKEDGKE